MRAIDAVCRRHGVALLAAALQFPLAHPAIASVIPGALTRAEVLDNVRALRVEIPAAFWTELKETDLLHPDAPVPSA